ncbi:tRNA 2-thiocytidine(32) synthetase TtcA [Halomonas sp. MA07-2]|uniref:tRNA 2-thiocytidine(32) synthetase TtcA n=1 Tax=Halomonas sp. MA07-2 TaxID=3440841 RepID=UPI003EEF91D7
MQDALIFDPRDRQEAPSVAASPIQEAPSPTLDALDARGRREFNKLQKRLRRQVGNAIIDYGMIHEGDRVMVCLSGGKDSYTLLSILRNLQRNAPIDFSLVAVNLDQKQPGFPEQVLPEYLASIGVEHHILERDTYSVVKEKTPEGKTTCALCSRLRRGSLYGFAEEIGATKVALGHHREDILETLFLNLFFGGSLKAMPPKLLADDGKNILIRPLAYCREADIAEYARLMAFPIIPCNLCGSQPNLQRQVVKEMLAEWEKTHPGRLESMFKAVTNVAPSQLGDRELFDFAGLEEKQARRLASRIDLLNE